MIKILVDVPVEPALLAQLETDPSLDIEVIPFSDAERELPVEQIQDVEVLFCTLPPANCGKMPKLRWIQIASSGYSQLFPHDLPARRIRATNARGCFDVPIAEWNMAMMVSLVRDMPQMMRNQRTRLWDRSANFQREVRGMTLGLWGYGGLARETARLARQFGMRVHVLTRKGVKPAHDVYRVPGTGDPEGIFPDRVFVAGSEAEFLSSLDFLVLAMPLTPQTEGIVGDKELRCLRRSAYILNPARGPLIQELPLIEALREGLIAGAAIDTHYEYPLPPEHPLWGFPNVILTPHVAGSSLNPMFTRRIWEIFVANLQRYTAGEALLNELSQQQLEGM